MQSIKLNQYQITEEYKSVKKVNVPKKRDAFYILSLLSFFTGWFIPKNLRDAGVDVFHRARLIVAFSCSGAIFTLVFSAIWLYMGSILGTLAHLAVGLIMTSVPFVLKRKGSVLVSGNLLGLFTNLLLLFIASITGGYGTHTLMWNIAIPMGVSMMAGYKSGVAWAAIVTMQFFGFYALDRMGFVFPQHLTSHMLQFYELSSLTGLLLLVLLFALLYECFKNKTLNELHLISITDDLTGLANTRHFYQVFKELLKNSEINGQKFAIVIMDMDNFKCIVDTYGHQIGSQTLVVISRIIRKHVPQNNIICRFGGDEFIILLSNTDKKGAVKRAEKIRQEIQALEAIYNGTVDVSCVTCSIGISVYPDNGHSLEKLFHLADQAMYMVKNKAKNGPYVWEDDS